MDQRRDHQDDLRRDLRQDGREPEIPARYLVVVMALSSFTAAALILLAIAAQG